MHKKAGLVLVGVILAGLIVGMTFPEGFQRVNRQPNFVHVLQLAERIKNREDFVLVDLRDSTAYASFHLPGAKHLPLEDLDPSAIRPGTVFYSGEDVLARRLWDQLPDTLRDEVYILYGGVTDWYDHILYPTLPFGTYVTNAELVDRIDRLSRFYGGYAEFKADKELLNYYQINLHEVHWPKVQPKGQLVRKGC